MRKTKPQSFSCTPEKWESLEPIAKELGISRNALIAKLVDLTLENGGIDFAVAAAIPTASSIDAELKQEQLQKAKNANDLHELKKRNLDAETRIKEYHADNLEVIGDKPSRTAKEAMKHHVEGTVPFDENAIHCEEEGCRWATNPKDSLTFQINRLRDHVQIYHKRNLTREENQELEELLV